MCGRYSLFHPWEEVADYYGLVETTRPNLPPRYNIAPTQKSAIVRAGDDGRRRLALMRWGLLPPFAKDTRMAARFINARSETVATQGAYKAAFRARRCIVAADGFYEWRKEGKARLPFRIARPDDALLGFAGLWQAWRVPSGLELRGEYAEYAPGDWIETYTILTTGPSEAVAAIHNRMPVILNEADFDGWLGGPSPGDHAALLKPYEGALTVRPVSRRVNNVANDDAGCIAPPGDGDETR